MTDRIAAAFSSHDKAAALMPYLMGGYPDLDASRAVGEACADAGADLLELGVPFSDPLADGPTIHAAATAALDAGAAGLIVPDLPHEEAGELRVACDERGLALVPLVAPTTPEERLVRIAGEARGFVYTVSLTGTTGERDELPPKLPETVARVRAATDLPVAVGFGISSGDQARRVAEIADGVIVGSRVVRAAGEGGAEAVRGVVAELAAALGSARG